jgi:hypothetical protein
MQSALLSLDVLDRLSNRWKNDPPLGRLRNFPFSGYRKRLDDLFLKGLPPELVAAINSSDWSTVRAYLRANQRELEPTINDPAKYRTTQYVAALAILSEPVDWSSLTGIAGCTSPTVEEDPNFMTLPVLQPCLDKLQEIMCRIGAECQR